VLSMLPAEIEQRRLKTAQLAYKKGDRVLRSFRNLVELPQQLIAEEKEAHRPTAPAISLTIKKKLQSPKAQASARPAPVGSRPKNSVHGSRPRSTEEDSMFGDLSDTDSFVPTHKKSHKKSHHKPRELPSSRRNTMSDSRRSSIHTSSMINHHGFGSSQFDFDTSVMDIGLPTITAVDCQEILLPSFRRKDVLGPVEQAPCTATCPMDESCWEEIRRQHADLEAQERRVGLVLNPPRNSIQRSSRD